MATRTKTIEYATSVDTAIVLGGVNADKSLAVYIPETGLTFRSVTLMAYVRGANTVAKSLGVVNLSIATNSGFTGATVQNLGTPNANSGESETWGYACDVTAFFNSNWAGASNTWWLRWNGVTCEIANLTFKLVITYDYDDTSATQIKTVRIPIESTRSVLTTALQTIGGATAIPAIGGSYLPEASVVVRQAFLELCGNEASNTTVDTTTSISINGGSSIPVWFAEQNLSGNGCWAWFCHDITAEDLSVARSLEAVSSVTNRMDYLGGWVTVTYEFNPTTTTRVLNSLLLGAIDSAGRAGVDNTSANADSWGRDIFIQETGTITMKESGVLIGSNSIAACNMNIKVGAQAFTLKTHTLSTVQLGQNTFMHRIDGGGVVATPFATLAHGKNAYKCSIYSSTTSDGWGVNGYLVLNYESDKHPDGVGAHSRTIHQLIDPATSDNYFNTVNSKGVLIAETDYWLNGACTDVWANIDNTTNGVLVVQAERLAGESEGDGLEPIGLTAYRADNENHFITGRYASRSSWKRWTGDPDPSRMDIEALRTWVVQTPMLATVWYGLWVTYHTISYTIAGAIENYTGDGSGIEVDIFRKQGAYREHIATVTTTTGGAFTFTWYDDTETTFTASRQDATHVGRSDDGLAV